MPNTIIVDVDVLKEDLGKAFKSGFNLDAIPNGPEKESARKSYENLAAKVTDALVVSLRRSRIPDLEEISERRTSTETSTATRSRSSGDTETTSGGSGGSGGSITPPSGTGFVHITAGTVDEAAKLVTNEDVENSAGIVESKLDLNFPTHDPANDPTSDEKAALAGTDGSPSGSNKYVTDSDPRLVPLDPASSVTSETSFGQSPDVGSSDEYARADHTHGTPTGVFVRGGTLYTNEGILHPANLIVWRAPFSCTVTNVRGYRVGGTTADVNARRNGASNHLGTNLTLGSSGVWTDGGAVSNTSYTAGDTLEIMIVSVTGEPSQVAVQVDFVRT